MQWAIHTELTKYNINVIFVLCFLCDAKLKEERRCFVVKKHILEELLLPQQFFFNQALLENDHDDDVIKSLYTKDMLQTLYETLEDLKDFRLQLL